MHSVLDPLSGAVAILVAASLLTGLVFDKIGPGPLRDAMVGLVAAVAALALAAATPAVTDGPAVDGRSPILLVAGFFGGPAAALAALPLPLGVEMETAGRLLSPGVAAMLAAACLGTALRRLHDRRGWPIGRKSVLVLAAASPLPALPLLDTPFAAETAARAAPSGLATSLAWLPTATAVLGLLILNEAARAGRRRQEETVRRLHREADHVSADFFVTQLRHHFNLHDRYGAQFAYLIVAIDEAESLREAMRETDFAALRTRVARLVRDNVRDCDVCAPAGLDRFAVLLPYTGASAMALVADRIRHTIADTFGREGRAVTVSVGMAHVDDANGPDDLPVLAEGALALARQATPRGAIGPRPALAGSHRPVVRSFPGALVEPAPRGPGSPTARHPAPSPLAAVGAREPAAAAPVTLTPHEPRLVRPF